MIHAIFPLQDDIVTSETLTIWSRIHQTSAGIFFVLVIIHTCYFIYIIRKKQFVDEYLDKRSRMIRVCCVIGSCITVVIAMAIHTTTQSMFGDENGENSYTTV